MNHDERVRAVSLDIAEERLNDSGKVNLTEVADAALVSKSEIREQFPRASDLLVGLLDRWLDRFDDAVERELDPQDQEAGQLTRAFVLASLSEDPALRTPWRRASVVASALGRPEVMERLRAWLLRWEVELSEDRVHPDRLQLALLAVQGLTAVEILTGGTDTSGEDLDLMRSSLMALLTHPGASLAPAPPE